MSDVITYRYSGSQLRSLLSKFQDAVDRKEYTEKIPYDTWRKLMRITDDVQIDLANSIVKIFNPKDNNVIYSVKIYDWGFGRFFYDEVFKKEWNKDMTLNTKAYGVCNCDAADQAASTASTAINVTTDSITWTYSDKTGYTTPYDTNTITGVNANWLNVTTLDERIEKLEKKINDMKKENGNMKGFNFDFGPCGNTVRLSMYGMAIQNVAGEWVSYNPDSGEIINVDVFNMADGGKYMYKMPVAISDVAVGDIVIHNRVPMFVTAVNENGTFDVTDVRAGEAKTIIPSRNMFNFNYIIKVVSLFGAFTNAPTADQPFGNMLPFLMMGEGKDIDPMMMFFMMGQGGNIQMNPMMMYFMMKDNKDFDPMMMFMMMNQAQPAHTCNCGKTPVNPAAQV